MLEFDGDTFEFLDVFIPPGADGIDTPTALAFGPEGNLFVVHVGPLRGGTLISEFDGLTGAFVQDLTYEFPTDIPITFIAVRPRCDDGMPAVPEEG